MSERLPSRERMGGWFRRGPWEQAATLFIGVGIVMLMQPFSLVSTAIPSSRSWRARSLSSSVSHFPD